MKVVCRIIDLQGEMLGWCEHDARLRGDGKLRASSDVAIPIEKTGESAVLSVHWCEVNVETRVQMPFTKVRAGDFMTIFPYNAILIDVGPMPGPLPNCTTRSTVVGIPAGQIGAVGNR